MKRSPLAIDRPKGRNPQRSGAYVGVAGYGAILACTKQPSTSVQVSERTGVSPRLAKLVLQQLHVMRLVHRVDWVRPTGRGFDLPVYMVGDGIDVLARRTKAGHPMPHADARPKMNLKIVAFCSIVQALYEPRDFRELLHQASVSKDTLRRALQRLHALGLCYVHERRRQASGVGPFVRIWHFGIDQPDADRPALVDRQARDRNRRQLRHGQWGNVVVALKRIAGYQLPRFDRSTQQSA